MDHDKQVAEIENLQNLLNKITDKDSEQYLSLAKRLADQVRLLMEFDEQCDKQNERQNKLDFEQRKFDKELEFDREKFLKELELKTKELELKMELEKWKLSEGCAEADARRKAEKRQALWDIIKILLQILGSAALIVITGKIEQNVILGQHKWSWIQKLMKG